MAVILPVFDMVLGNRERDLKAFIEGIKLR